MNTFSWQIKRARDSIQLWSRLKRCDIYPLPMRWYLGIVDASKRRPLCRLAFAKLHKKGYKV